MNNIVIVNARKGNQIKSNTKKNIPIFNIFKKSKYLQGVTEVGTLKYKVYRAG